MTNVYKFVDAPKVKTKLNLIQQKKQYKKNHPNLKRLNRMPTFAVWPAFTIKVNLYQLHKSKYFSDLLKSKVLTNKCINDNKAT